MPPGARGDGNGARRSAGAPKLQGIAAAARQHRPRLRGRVGGRWLSVQTAGTGFQQPALDLRFDGFDRGGGHVDVSFDMRNRRTVRTGTGSGTSPIQQVSRVYRASLVVRSLDSHRSFSIGRQTSSSLSSVSLFRRRRDAIRQ